MQGMVLETLNEKRVDGVLLHFKFEFSASCGDPVCLGTLP